VRALRTIIPSLALLAFAACAHEYVWSDRYVWSEDGASPVGIGQAQAMCKEEARGYDFLGGSRYAFGEEGSTVTPTRKGDRYSSLRVSAARRQADVFDSCMQQLGYTRVPVGSEREDGRS